MRERSGRFVKVYIIFIAVLLAVFAAALIVLWNFLEGYQQRVDEAAAIKAAEDAERERVHAEYMAPLNVIQAFFADADADWWAGEWFREHPGGLDSYDGVKDLFEMKIKSDGYKLYKAEDYSEQTPVYVVKDGAETIARVYLTGAAMDWCVERTEIMLAADKCASLETVEGIPVILNGIRLGEEHIVSERSCFADESYADQLVEPVKWVTYRVEGLLCDAEIREDTSGINAIYSDADGVPVLLRSDETAENAMEKSVNFVAAMLHYYMSGETNTRSNMSECLHYVVSGSEAYKTIKASYDGITWNSAYTNQKTEIYADEAIIWAENCFSIDVHYKAQADYGGKTVDYSSGVYRLYFYDFGSGWGIYSLKFM